MHCRYARLPPVRLWRCARHYFHDYSDVWMCTRCSGNDWCVQTKGRRTLRSAESKVDKVDAEDVLSLLFRSRVPYPQPGILVRGWCKSCRPEAPAEHCSQNKSTVAFVL